MELISVVIPVYNTKKYLNKCVSSFFKQKYTNIEIILVDDGSTDGSSDLCDYLSKNDDRVKVIHKNNGGLSDARNVGIENASGSYITFFDSDDYADADFLLYLYNLKNKYHSQVAICGYDVVNENGSCLFSVSSYKEGAISKIDLFSRMLDEDGITVSSCFKLFDITLFKNVRFPYGMLCEDNGTTYKIIDAVTGEIAYGPNIKCHYVMRNNSIMRSSFNKKKLDMIFLTDEMCDYLDLNYPVLKNKTIRRRIYARFNVLRQMSRCTSDFDVIKTDIISYIKNRKNFILLKKNVPFRDKIACLSLLISSNCFFLLWKIYSFIRYKK